MLKSFLLSFLFGIRPRPSIQVARCPIIRIYFLEKGTLRHRLAQESLLLIDHRNTPKDHDAFTDNGDLILSVYYEDLCLAYHREIQTEEYNKLRVL